MYFKNLLTDLNSIKAESLNNFFSIILISLLPAFIVSSSILINVSVTIIGFLFLFDVIKNKKYEYFNNKIFVLLIIFFIYLIINLFFSINFHNLSLIHI